MSKHLIHGSGNKVALNNNRVALINCDDYVATEEDDNKAVFNNGKVVIGDDGASIQLNYETKTSSFIVDAGNKGIYFLDCTGGDIDVVLQPTANYPVFFIREDNSGNDILLIAGTGNINGAASYPMPTQYQKNSVVFNGTNFRV